MICGKTEKQEIVLGKDPIVNIGANLNHIYRVQFGQFISEYLADCSRAPRARMEKNQYLFGLPILSTV